MRRIGRRRRPAPRVLARMVMVLAVVALPAGARAAAGQRLPAGAARTNLSSQDAPFAPAGRAWPALAPLAPAHGRTPFLAYGGHAEIRAAQDRVAGISNPDWMSVPRISAFATWRVHPRIELATEATYERSTDDLVVERALVDARVGDRWFVHGGVLQAPLGRVNTDHAAPSCDFDGLSFVATEIIGVPNPQPGIGIHGTRAGSRGALWSYEFDAVSGYDEGVITRGSSGTRLPMGRDNFGRGRSWALVGRMAVQPRPGAELGLSMLGGAYNPLQLDGKTVDPSRALGLVVADGRADWLGFHFTNEAAVALVDVPRGLEGLYAERQWAASAEIARPLLQRPVASWPNVSIGAALRLDAVDYDAQRGGDSRSRMSASLNLRRVPWSVLRTGWYYERHRDRFENLKLAAGLVFSFATYF